MTTVEPLALETILKLALAAALGIIGWFLRQTAADLKQTSTIVQQMQVVQAEHNVRLKYLEERKES